MRGFALPLTLVALSILGLLAAVGFLLSWMELRSVRWGTAGTRAYHAAEAGLATALAAGGRPAGATGSVTLPGGVASLAFEPLLELIGHGGLYRVRSTGSVAERGRTVSHTVSRVMWAGDPPAFDAALSLESTVGAGSVRAGAATGYVTGHPPPGCARPSGAGIASHGTPATGAIALMGAPPHLSPSASSTPVTRAGLRWSALLTTATPGPDATVPGDPWPSPGAGPAYVRITSSGPLGPGHSGRGVIVATGDLDLASGFAWRGALLIGGSLRIFGDVDLRGAVFAGLDGSGTATVDLGDGAVVIAFDPCLADAEASRLEPYPAAIPGMWRDYW